MKALRAPLLRWYRTHRRDLPWRRTRDPYAIWVAETMLQQTRSETVLRYYPSFLERFPTAPALARAREGAVLAAWSGLGYYTRARNLRAAARVLAREHAGRLPRDPAALRSLPGVGRYTAGAVASIAFGVSVPVLDGNVARVLARVFRVPGRLRSTAVEARLWDLAETLVPGRSSGEWNQALMELGATLCTARSPDCRRCPIRRACGAHLAGQVERFPEPATRPRTRRIRRSSVVLEHRGRVLLVHREDGRLLRGLWEFPNAPLRSGGSARVAADDAIARLGAGRPPLDAAGVILHTIMNQRIETRVFRSSLVAPMSPRHAGVRWVRWRNVGALPLSALGLKILSRFRPEP